MAQSSDMMIDTPLERARRVTASQTWDVEDPMLVRAHGAHVWDTDGKVYVDLTSCSGAAPLGAAHPAVVDRVTRHLVEDGGILPATLSPARVDVAERLVELFPCADRALFFRTGSCATTAAVRLARVSTGARTVLTSGYHGWHDWQLQYRPHLALPDRDPDTVDFGYDLDRLRDLLADPPAGHDRVAAVIVTPEVSVFPPQYLRDLETLVRGAGALLIVDEVMTGFRYRGGGYANACGVVPDLITISKGLANGSALSAVLGRADVMLAHERTFLTNTFQRETTPFAAAAATLDVYASTGALDRCHDVGARLMSGLRELFAESGTPAWTLGHPSMFDTVFADPAAGDAFFAGLRRRGVLMRYGARLMPSAAMSDEDLELVLAAAARTVEELEPASVPRDRAAATVAAVRYATEHFAATPGSVRRWQAP